MVIVIGSLKLIGQDTKVDKPGGMKWLLKAAAQGEVGAMACLYSIYKNGLPDYLPPDNSKGMLSFLLLNSVFLLIICISLWLFGEVSGSGTLGII